MADNKVSDDYRQGYKDALADVMWQAAVKAYVYHREGLQAKLRRDQLKECYHAESLGWFVDTISGFRLFAKHIGQPTEREGKLKNDFLPDEEAVKVEGDKRFESLQRIKAVYEAEYKKERKAKNG